MSRYKIASSVRGLSNPQNFWYYKNHTLVVENYADQGMISIRANNRIVSSIQLDRPIHFSCFQDGTLYCLEYDERTGATNVQTIYPTFVRDQPISRPHRFSPPIRTMVTLTHSRISIPGFFASFACDTHNFYLGEGYDPNKKGGYSVVAFARNSTECWRQPEAKKPSFRVPPKLKMGIQTEDGRNLLVLLPYAESSDLLEFTSKGKHVRSTKISFIGRDFTMLADGSIKVCGCSINQVACTALISKNTVQEREIFDFAELTQISPDGTGYLARSPNTWERPASWHITKGDQSYRLYKKPCSVWFGESLAYYV